MILDELTLHNFGTYAGRQIIKLRPESRSAPIVLIGGLNGRGKTTLLDGLQLALYGKRARCSNRGTLAYDEFLRRSIHRRAPAEDGASVELRFLHNEEGRVHSYEVRRSWLATGASVRERVQVSKDEHVDKLLSEYWDEHVENFLPLGLSTLFLFDGEKIEDLATPEKGKAILNSAVASLLGLELVDRLESDLLVLERRKAAQLLPPPEKKELENLDAELEQLHARKLDLEQRRANLQNAVDRAERGVIDTEQHFRREGGDFYRDRESFEFRRTELEREIHRIEDELRDEAAGVLPLLLVRDLLSDVDRQYDREDEAATNKAAADVLVGRDADIVRKFTALAGSESAALLDQLLCSDRQARVTTHDEPYLHMSAEAGVQLKGLLGMDLERAQARAVELVATASNLEKQLGDVQRVLASVPDAENLERLTDAMEKARRALNEERSRLEHVEAELVLTAREIAHKAQRRASLARAAADSQLERADDHRVLMYSARVRETLDTFRREVLAKNVAKIERLVFDSFRQLIGKEALLSALRIDPETLSITLFDAGGSELPAERLSAGERQVLAVSLLWGLGRASGRPLPTVIDTPLGRLDSTIRENIVRNYFPNASHQVVLLSTDTEVDTDALRWMDDAVGRKYQLTFDDGLDATTINEGYFWEDSEHVA